MQPYQELFLKEIDELADRTQKLEAMIEKYAKKELDFTPTCSLELLTMQLNAMKSYLTILQVRKGIEGL